MYKTKCESYLRKLKEYLICVETLDIECAFGLKWKIKIILLFSLFLLLFIGHTSLFGTIHGHTVLFQLTFTFIYSTFSNNFSISVK